MPPPLAFLPVTSRALPKINGRVYAPASSVQALQKSYILQSYCFAWHNVRWGCYVKLALRAHTSRWSVTTPPHPPLITVLALLALSLNPPLGRGARRSSVVYCVGYARAPKGARTLLIFSTLTGWHARLAILLRASAGLLLTRSARSSNRAQAPGLHALLFGGFITQRLPPVVE